ncbi:acetoacetate--CoA ligase [Amycolatopsis sp. NPDC051758]|uniref:acetoacetate--CoA ligase n=1 Tax=Amycolatopsis sp. NPDC051758 TaxID=3363935 RepID=UPI0037875AD6
MSEPLYTLPPALRQETRAAGYLGWLRENRGLALPGWDELWRWSVTDLEGFWGSLWDYFGVRSRAPYERVLADARMPGAVWFPGARLNYAEHCLDGEEDDGPAVLAYSQTRAPIRLTRADLRDQVARARAGLRGLGVGKGDRVVAYLPNIPETIVAYLATASLGAVWAACAPEFGAPSVLDRFGQLEPKVLLTVSSYTYGEKPIDRRAEVALIRDGLPGVEHVVDVHYGPDELPDALAWDDLLAEPGPLEFEPVPFDHPLCVLFSSGTTGKPKAIVHGHGGILLEHLKSLALHWDLRAGDRMLWFTTTAWMMWQVLVSCLLVRASIVLLDGNPLHPDLRHQWRMAELARATHFGSSPGYLMACRKEGVRPGEEFDLAALRHLPVAGSPLPAEGFRWIHEQLGDTVLLNVGSGGTDVCTGLVQGSPLQPVWAGQMSGPALGVHAQSFDPQGHAVVGELGELVVTAPMPSMPVGLWGDDPGGSRYRATYFDTYPGVWRHGDWVRFSSAGSCVITGRSDATLNRGGVRLGTAEFYRVVEELPEIDDSLVVHLEDSAGGPGELLLFVVTRQPLDGALRANLKATIRSALSPRHVPDTIEAVPAIPYNRTGKKLEIPVKHLLRGAAPDTVAAPGSLSDPTALDAFSGFARRAPAPERTRS